MILHIFIHAWGVPFFKFDYLLVPTRVERGEHKYTFSLSPSHGHGHGHGHGKFILATYPEGI